MHFERRATINFGRAKDIAGVFSIPFKSAMEIVKYRTIFGQFNNTDELLKIPDLPPADYKAIMRAFRAPLYSRGSLQKMPPVPTNTRFTQNPQFCGVSGDLLTLQGVHAPRNTNENRTRQRSAPARVHGVHMVEQEAVTKLSRAACRSRAASNYHTEETSTNSRVRPATSVSARKHHGNRANNVQRDKTDAGSLNSHRSKARSRGARTSHERKDRKSPIPPSKSQISPISPVMKRDLTNQHRPAVTVQTSPCGNRINVSCTIDRNLLRQQASLSFYLDGNDKKPVKGLTASVPKLVIYSGDGNKSNLSIRTSSQTPAGSILSQDNLLEYEKANLVSAEDKRRRIERWVRRVNSERCVNRLTSRSHGVHRSLLSRANAQLQERRQQRILLETRHNTRRARMQNYTAAANHDKEGRHNGARGDVARLVGGNLHLDETRLISKRSYNNYSRISCKQHEDERTSESHCGATSRGAKRQARVQAAKSTTTSCRTPSVGSQTRRNLKSILHRHNNQQQQPHYKLPKQQKNTTNSSNRSSCKILL